MIPTAQAQGLVVKGTPFPLMRGQLHFVNSNFLIYHLCIAFVYLMAGRP